MLTMAQKVLPSNPKDGAIIAVPQTESNFSSSCSVKTFFEGVGLEPRAFHMHTATEYIFRGNGTVTIVNLILI